MTCVCSSDTGDGSSALVGGVYGIGGGLGTIFLAAAVGFLYRKEQRTAVRPKKRKIIVLFCLLKMKKKLMEVT